MNILKHFSEIQLNKLVLASVKLYASKLMKAHLSGNLIMCFAAVAGCVGQVNTLTQIF